MRKNCMRNGCLITLVLLLALSAGSAVADQLLVSDVVAEQIPGTPMIRVTYDLQTVGDGPVMVRLFLLSEHGELTSECMAVTGSVGADVLPGTGLEIVWNAALDVPGYEELIGRMRVFAEDSEYAEDFVFIPPGAFNMGSPEDEPGRDDGETLHGVSLTRGFFLSRYEVTEEVWNAVMGGDREASQLPKTGVTWDEAVAFCNELSIREGLTPVYIIHGPDGNVSWAEDADGYRLPTEAEWEYACRAGAQTAFFNGPITHTECIPQDPVLNASGWYCGNTLEPQPVGQKQANARDLYDMHGNVDEWVWCGLRSYTSEPQVDPVTHADPGDVRVVRSGTFDSPARDCRSASRAVSHPDIANTGNGLRLTRTAFPLPDFALATIDINPVPAGLDAPWQLAGPYNYLAEGSGTATLSGLYPGEYTLIWGEVPGWDSPMNDTRTLESNGQVTIDGEYIQDANPFVTQWDTSLSGGSTVTLALAGEVSATIDWGDGTYDIVYSPGPHSHDYGVDDIYTVRVTGSVTAYNSHAHGGGQSDRDKLVSVDSWGHLGFTSLAHAFSGATNLLSVPASTAGIWAVYDMSHMFAAAVAFNHDISAWDVANVMNMGHMFSGASVFNQDISGWDVSLVENMDHMFAGASVFNQDLFWWCVELIPVEPPGFDSGAANWTLRRPVWGVCMPKAFVTTWNTALGFGNRVTLSPAGSVNGKIHWGDGNVTQVSSPGPHVHHYAVEGEYTVVFAGSATSYNMYDNGYEPDAMKLIRVDNWGQVGFTSLAYAFYGASSLDWVPPNTLGLESVTNMSRIFWYATSFNANITGWDTSNITNMRSMFHGASAFNRNIGDWDTSNVTDMRWMFHGASSFNQNLSSWCVHLIPELPQGFDTGATSWTLPRPLWGTCNGDPPGFTTTWDTSLGAGTTVTLALSGVVDATVDWGDGTIQHVGVPGPQHTYGQNGIYTVTVTGSVTAYNSDAHGGSQSDRDKLVSVDSWGYLGFTSLAHAFSGAANLASVPGATEGIGAVVDMSHMFDSASVFDHDISAWDVANVTDMSHMFSGASSFNRDIGGWDVSSVENMDHMFHDASSFNQDLSGWCVELIPTQPQDFDTGATAWTLPRPVWGTCYPADAFVTQWNTHLGFGRRITLSLAGSVNATINWGDGAVTNVTSPGPHVHTYAVEGEYRVIVTGSATSYNMYDNGYEPDAVKLVRVDNWGQLGFTSLAYAFYGASNLVSVPPNTVGLESVTNMSRIFWYATSFNANIEGWDTSSVTNMRSMFHGASAFNRNIGGWDTSSVTDMRWMFHGASSFNRDLSGWCVLLIPELPQGFDTGATSWTLPRPVWGTCPR